MVKSGSILDIAGGIVLLAIIAVVATHPKIVTDVTGGVQATIGGTVEIEDWPKPACVAEVILRYIL